MSVFIRPLHRLFLDTEDNKAELKKLLRLLLLKEENPSEDDIKSVEKKIDSRIRQLPKQLLKIGAIGFAGYGVLSALADMDLDTAKDVAGSVASDMASDVVSGHAEAASDHIKDNAQGILTGVGKVVKNLLDDLF